MILKENPVSDGIAPDLALLEAYPALHGDRCSADM